MKNLVYIISIILFFQKISEAQYTENYAGSFNGINSYVAVPYSASLNPTSAITLEAWVYPTQLLNTTMAVIGKNYQTSYFLGVQTSGRIVFYPKGGSSLRSRVSGVVPVNKWTHIAGTFDGINTRIYINGVLDTSTTGITGSVSENFDSLFIGADRIGTPTALFFKGRIDNVRLWGYSRSDSQISSNMFVPLEIFYPTGNYNNLRASFQLDNNADNYAGGGVHNGFLRNVSFVDYNNKGVNHMDYNNNLVLNGTTDYFTVNNNNSFNATNAVTLEAWIRKSFHSSQNGAENIVNKSGLISRYNYALFESFGDIYFNINSGSFSVSVKSVYNLLYWTHIAATYNSADGSAKIYINGELMQSTNFAGNPLIQNDPDPLYIGSIGASFFEANKFKGQIDDVRIWKEERTQTQIKDNMFNKISDPNLANFEFDKNTNSFEIGNSTQLALGIFGGNAHISSSKKNLDQELTSPILYFDKESYSADYFLSNNPFFIPDDDLTGITDSVYVPYGGNIFNVKTYVSLSHTFLNDLILKLISPQGTEVRLFYGGGFNANDIMTIFSDNADSSVASSNSFNGPGLTPPYSPSVKPYDPLNVLNGQNQQGWWKLRFIDYQKLDFGFVHKWGIKILSSPLNHSVKLNAFIQGFYESSSDKMIKDTLKIYLKNIIPPYNNLDSSKSVIDSAGKGNFIFQNITSSDSFYISVKHRNSIEIWSNIGLKFLSDTLNFDFTNSNTQAFGNNLIQVNNSPVRFAIYSGDVNQDGTVDISDVSLIDNDAFNFESGYLPTDLNGDGIIDVADAVFADNNGFNFVSKITP